MMVERPSHPDDPAALIQQAHVLWEDHEFNGALALLHRAEAAGGGAPAYVFAAAILIDQGRKDEAQRNLVEALRLDPQNAQAKKLIPVAQAKPTE
jgi:Flp pilus assembly protein TadD